MCLIQANTILTPSSCRKKGYINLTQGSCLKLKRLHNPYSRFMSKTCLHNPYSRLMLKTSLWIFNYICYLYIIHIFLLNREFKNIFLVIFCSICIPVLFTNIYQYLPIFTNIVDFSEIFPNCPENIINIDFLYQYLAFKYSGSEL